MDGGRDGLQGCIVNASAGSGGAVIGIRSLYGVRFEN